MLSFNPSISFLLLSRENNWLVELHNHIGATSFLLISVVTAVVLSLWLIPFCTHLMTNSAAGLAAKFFEAKQRTLVINSTTNLPELFLMSISFALGRLGGVATPLGSNLANIYLIFALAPLIVLSKWLCFGQISRIRDFIHLLQQERKLLIWHLLLSLTLLSFSSLACWSITGIVPFVISPNNPLPRTGYFLFSGGFLCLIGVGLYFWFERDLKNQRPEIFEDLDAQDFEASWINLFWGTGGVILACYILNLFFLALTQIYEPFLTSLFGVAIFAYLHYFIGSLISSLPETTVAVENYQRLTYAELNTALASATVSNMSNLAIAFFGTILAGLFVLSGLISAL